MPPYRSSSEQSSGILALLALAFLVGATVKLELPESEPDCVTVQGYEYEGRDSEGRPSWNYTEMERCYE